MEPGLVPARDVTLSWPTFSAASDQAGLCDDTAASISSRRTSTRASRAASLPVAAGPRPRASSTGTSPNTNALDSTSASRETTEGGTEMKVATWNHCFARGARVADRRAGGPFDTAGRRRHRLGRGRGTDVGDAARSSLHDAGITMPFRSCIPRSAVIWRSSSRMHPSRRSLRPVTHRQERGRDLLGPSRGRRHLGVLLARVHGASRLRRADRRARADGAPPRALPRPEGARASPGADPYGRDRRHRRPRRAALQPAGLPVPGSGLPEPPGRRRGSSGGSQRGAGRWHPLLTGRRPSVPRWTPPLRLIVRLDDVRAALIRRSAGCPSRARRRPGRRRRRRRARGADQPDRPRRLARHPRHGAPGAAVRPRLRGRGTNGRRPRGLGVRRRVRPHARRRDGRARIDRRCARDRRPRGC